MIELSKTMIDLSKMPLEADAEAIFRRGFTQGAQEVLRVVKLHLSLDQIALLRQWAENDLGTWLMSDGQFVVAPRAPDLST